METKENKTIWNFLDAGTPKATANRFGKIIRASNAQRALIIKLCQNNDWDYDAKDLKKISISEASNIISNAFKYLRGEKK